MNMSQADNSPVFVLGSARSGTTLVYSMLLASGMFAVYEAETMLFEVCRPKYGSLRKERNFRRFMDDWTESKQFSRSKLDADEFTRGAEGHRGSYAEFLEFFMSSIARKQGKNRWAEQTPGHVFYMDRLSREFPGAKFIHVVRDGRDVALSKRKLGWSGSRNVDPLKTLIWGGIGWEMSVLKGRASGRNIGRNYMEIRYEDLVTNLDGALEKISEFIEIEIRRSRLLDCDIGSLRRGNSAFSDTTEGISTKGVNRWKAQLSKKEVGTLNVAIGNTLEEFGYEVDDDGSRFGSVSAWRVAGYSTWCRAFLRAKKILREKTVFGRFTSMSIEIGMK